MLDWFHNNYTWIFSGIGSTILAFFIGLFVGKRKSKNQANIKNSNNNNIIQKWYV